MTRPCLFFILFLTACTGNPAFGQIGEAKKQMALYNYSEALPVLNKILQKDGKDKKEAALLMAVCFLKQNDVLNARLWFAKAIEYGNNEPSTLFSYAQVLRSCGDYLKAKECFQKYAGISPNDSRAGILANNCDSAIAWKDIPAGYEVKNALSLNSEQSEFGPVFYGNSLCFTSDRLASDNKHDTYGWTGNAYLHLYFADPVYPGDTYNDYREIRPAPDLFNKDYHDGPATFNDSLTEVFFTRTLQYMDKGKKEKGLIRTHLLKIYSSERKGSKWGKPVPFFLNNDNYSVGHPALSGDGITLIFVSDMKGGYGGTDLYTCRRENDKWGQPVNMGPVINTFGNEMFPFLAGNGDLYFASDGHPGYGGLDIFVSHRLNDSTWSKPKNLNQPVNSSYDDFSLCLTNDNKNGVFSSNRPGGLGNDDLYFFRRLGKALPATVKTGFTAELSGYVKDKTSLKPINNATVFLLDRETHQVLILKTDSNGFYSTPVIPGRSYTAKAMQTGYIADCYLFTPDTVSKATERNAPHDLLLDKLQNNRTFVLENIYYDLDKWNIRPDAKLSLDKLVMIMKENPVNIELGSHTDSRASEAYNLQLSQKRAESAVEYLVSQGINPGRLTARGYGESQLVNKCRDGVPCTEAEHQQNRRTEFKVISRPDVTNPGTFSPESCLQGEIIDSGSLPDGFFNNCEIR